MDPKWTAMDQKWTAKWTTGQIVLLLINIAGVTSETQRFREVPKSVLVSEGDDVELRCAVEHQKGKAQWTKDGFALGFERDVPGYPRYQYGGDPTLGEHHLVISGVTLQDDGEYQCQVGPTNEAPPIWAAANVTVLVAPSSINIVGWGDGAVVEVISGSSLALECLVADARPSPSLTWYRDGIELDLSKQRDTLEKGSRPRLMSIRSRLLIRAVPADDGQQFSCRGHHPALDRVPSALVASITLSVLHPPGAPVITGYSDGSVLIAGDTLDLTCSSRGGNPRPWVFWYRNDTLVDDTTSLDGNTVVNIMELVATSNEDNAVYECRVTSDMLGEPKSDIVTLTVHYSPSSVQIKGTNSIALGDRLNAECETSPSNPQAVVKWTIEGNEVKTGSTVSVKSPFGGWVTRSKLLNFKITSKVVKNETQIEVICEAVNPELNKIVAEKHVVALVKPAGPPILEGLSGEAVAGTKISFTCFSEGGNPPPTLILYKRGTAIPSEGRASEEGTKAFAEVIVTPEDNGKEITCQVNHPAAREPVTISQRLTVLFPPSKVVGRASPSAVEEGSHVTLSCSSSSSSPEANITWYSEGSILTGASQTNEEEEHNGKSSRSELVVRAQAADDGRIYTCEASNGLLPVQATNVTISVSHAPIWVIRPPDQVDVYETEDLVVSATAAANPGPLRYWWRHGQETLPATGGELRIHKILREDQGNYSVSAYSPRGSVNATFFVNVQYPPERLKAAKKVTVGERGTATIECSAKGNPAPQIAWTRVNRSEVLSSGVGVAHLSLESAKRDDTGVYECSASNSVGIVRSTECQVIVTHGAVIIRDSTLIPGSWALEGERGSLVCLARAAPNPSFHWSTSDGSALKNGPKYKISEPQLQDGLSLWVSELEIQNVAPSDYMDYRCTTNNALGADTALLTLRPPDKPLPPSDLRLVNKSSSSVTLSWRKSKLEGGPVRGYTIRYRNEESINSQEVPVGANVTASTIGNLVPLQSYTVTVYAHNERGSSSFIEPPLRVTLPDVPRGIFGNPSGGTSGLNNKMKWGGVTIGGWRVPRLVLLITTLAGATLLVLNIAIIACFVRRRNNVTNISASSSKTTTLGALGGGSMAINSSSEGGREYVETQNSSPKHNSIRIIPNRESDMSPDHIIKGQLMSPPPNGHLPRGSGNSLLVSENKCQEEDLLLESSLSVDLLQNSIGLEGSRSVGEKSSFAPSQVDDPLVLDQISLGSYRSGNTFGPIRNHSPLLQDENPLGIPQVFYQGHESQGRMVEGASASQKKNGPTSSQYASLNAAQLCDLGIRYFEIKCCPHKGTQGCSCPTSSHVVSYATLGSKNRHTKSSQFATLQRSRPPQNKTRSAHFDSPGYQPCRCGRPTDCQCQRAKDLTYQREACSLSPSGLETYNRRSSLNGPHHTQRSYESVWATARTRRNKEQGGVDKEEPKTGNKDQTLSTFKVRPDSPKNILNLRTRSSSIEIDSEGRTQMDAADLLLNLGTDSGSSGSSSSPATLSCNIRAKFPHDYVKKFIPDGSLRKVETSVEPEKKSVR